MADGALALLVCVIDLGVLSSFLAGAPDGGAPVLTLLASAVPYAALAWRRRAPVLVLAVMLGLLLIGAFAVPELSADLGIAVALYTVAAHCRTAISAAAAPVVYVAVTTVAIFDQLGQQLAPGDTPEGVVRAFVVVYALLVGVAWGFGRFVRAMRLSAGYQRELAELQRREAIRAERTAIAHDLHDVVAHAVVMMMLGTSAARFQLDRDTSQAAATLIDVEEAGARAMTELRAMLDVLREVDATQGPVPAESVLAGVMPLVASARRAGLVIAENRIGQPRPLERITDLAAVRIVQEALTNATKHAGPGTQVDVDIAWTEHRLLLRVTDDGRGEPVLTPANRSTRIGLAGLRERAASVGGRVEAGPLERGGFEVVAELPITGPAQAEPDSEAADSADPATVPTDR